MDMLNMMKNMPAVMGKMKEVQEDIAKIRVTGRSGGGMATVQMSGTGEVLAIKLEAEIVDKEDIEMLQDLIVAATADARKNMSKAVQGKMSGLTGGVNLSSLGINIPGLG